MIDPVLFTINLGSFQFSIYWYGVIVVISILIGQWIASIETRRRGEHPDHLWDGLVWAIPAGMIGAPVVRGQRHDGRRPSLHR